jgi:hypothetical protein
MSNGRQRARNQDNIDEHTKQSNDPNINKVKEGACCDKMVESFPGHIKAGCETIAAQGENNSWIVLGRDRVGNRCSGYGGGDSDSEGKSHTHCGMIDIVAGKQGGKATGKNGAGQELFADPDFKKDSARIYLSQKTRIDEAFGLKTSPATPNATPRSAIAMKADLIRIIGEEGIRLVTRANTENSFGGKIKGVPGIDLVAGNSNDPEKASIEPFVKGHRLIACLTRIADHLDALTGVVDTYINYQLDYNATLSTHMHDVIVGPGGIIKNGALPHIPTINASTKNAMNVFSKAKRSLMTVKINLGAFKLKYFANPGGAEYICSKYNNTN